MCTCTINAFFFVVSKHRSIAKPQKVTFTRSNKWRNTCTKCIHLGLSRWKRLTLHNDTLLLRMKMKLDTKWTCPKKEKYILYIRCPSVIKGFFEAKKQKTASPKDYFFLPLLLDAYKKSHDMNFVYELLKEIKH
jgi:hypothetical protein